jgi:hypothetical protein
MIQEIKIKNYKSFKDEITFSLEATKDTSFESSQVVELPDGTRLLRFAMIYGYNASGKSNLLSAIDTLHALMKREPRLATEPIGIVPFLLDKEAPQQNTSFELKFYINGTKYWYKLELNRKEFVSEILYFYKDKSDRRTELFNRKNERGVSIINFNTSIIKLSKSAIDEIHVKCLKNASVFTALNRVNINVEILNQVVEWVDSNIMPVIDNDSELQGWAEGQLQQNGELKNYLVNFLHKADFNITDIRPNIIRHSIPSELLEKLNMRDDIPESELKRLNETHEMEVIDTDFLHNVTNERGKELYTMPFGRQSLGTRQIFGIETAIYLGIKQQSFLSVDEIESSLHPNLVLYILKRFLSTRDNQSQMVISTHYVPLLDLVDDLFRKDSVWFTEKQENGATDLYSLVEFKGLNRISSIEKAYLNGNFGGISKIE